MEGPGNAYWQHTANVAEAGYVAEGAGKPDISPTIKEIYVRPAKVAGRLLLTHEIVEDAGDAFASALQADLAASLYNAESNLLLNGTVVGNGFAGINAVTGTITRAGAIGTTDVDALDVLSKAIVDLRADFFVPDLIFIGPGNAGRDTTTPRRQQTVAVGADRRRRASSTKPPTPKPSGAARSSNPRNRLPVRPPCCRCNSGAAVVYVSEGLTTFFDPYSQASTNVYQYIAETRIALARRDLAPSTSSPGYPPHDRGEDRQGQGHRQLARRHRRRHRLHQRRRGRGRRHHRSRMD